VIRLRDFDFGYSGSERNALSRVNLEFAAGEFSLVCGATGSGKSTLLKLMNGLAPHFTGGQASGQLEIDGKDFSGSLPHELAELVGFVNQQPESSFVTDTVEDEIVFGMEQLGLPRDQMQQGLERVTKALELEGLLDKPLAWLSGGQQQRVAIAASLAAGQKILLLDEPTSALDPKAAQEIAGTLQRLARDYGITVILVEHRIERVIELVDSIVVVANDGLVTKGGLEQFRNYHLVPPVIALSKKLSWPKVVTDLEEAKTFWQRQDYSTTSKEQKPPSQKIALNIENLRVSYGEKVAVQDVSFQVPKGQVLALVGKNGSGKSSLLWAIQGSGKRSSGQVLTEYGESAQLSAEERLCVLTLVPQKAADLLFLNSLSDELDESDKFVGTQDKYTSKVFESIAGRQDPNLHPRDLSAGQQLALVLAIQIAKGAEIVLLDEPTRGLDYAAKDELAQVIKGLRSENKTVLIASHDVEFVALVADRVIELSDGELISDTDCFTALGPNAKHPTQIAQITNLEKCLTLEDVNPID
jgi:energy-coupling factor transport system ATP-binding protein